MSETHKTKSLAKISNMNSLGHIFPESAERKRMSLVFAGLSCLICLALLAISAGFRASDYWSSAFERRYVLAISPVAEIQPIDQLETAKTILSNAAYVSSYSVISIDELKEEMNPIFADITSMKELPIPQFVKIEFSGNNIKSANEKLKTELSEIPGASIEGYHQAKAEYISAAHAIKLVSLSTAVLLMLITAAVTAVSVESGVLDNKKIINIMCLIGTDNKLISHLFIRSIIKRALKGAFAGLILACAVLALISILGAIEGLGVTFVFSNFVPGFEIILLIVLVPLTVVGVGYFSGQRTMNKLIKGFI